MTAFAQEQSDPRLVDARSVAQRAACETSYGGWVDVILALERGDRVAYARVSRLITSYLMRYRSYGVPLDACDDIRQDALLALIQSVQRGSLRDPKAFVAYAGALVRNMLLARMRGTRRGIALARRVREVRAVVRQGPCERELALLLDLEAAMRALPERQRRVIDALYVRGLRYAEAARELAMPLGTLKGLQVQGLIRLRRDLGVGSA